MAKTVSLAAKLDTATAADLRTEIAAADGDDLIFDAGAVEHLGGLCLELLISTARLWQASGHAVSFENIPKQMADDLTQFGLTPDTLVENAA